MIGHLDRVFVPGITPRHRRLGDERPFISGAPRDSQNGLYKLTFDGQAMSVQRHNGAWVFIVPFGETVARV